MDKKQLKKIRKMKPTEEKNILLDNKPVTLICLEKQQYLIITSTNFEEITYNELIKRL